MSTKNIIQDTLADEENLSVCLRGKWGCGKTHLWNEIADEENIDTYTVSLFGLPDIEAVKLKLIEAYVSQASNRVGWWQDFKINNSSINIKKVEDIAKSFGRNLNNIPFLKGAGSLATTIAFGQIRDATICFDDIERKSTKLELNEIFGLADFLRKERNCKIIFLSNTDKISALEPTFDKYFEKIFDVDITLSPSFDECCQLVFQTAEKYQRLSSACRELKISNIRILKSIQRQFDKITSISTSVSEPLAQQIARTTALFVWAILSGDGAPKIDFLLNIGTTEYFQRRPEWTEDEKRWATLTEGFGYRHQDNLNREIINFVLHGSINNGCLLSAINIKNEEARNSDLRQDFSKSWQLFHTSLLDNKEEIVEAMVSSYCAAKDVLHAQDANSAVNLLKNLGCHDQASKIRRTYEKAGASKDRTYWDRALHEGFNTNWDDELAALMDEKFAEFSSLLPPNEILAKMGSSSSVQNEWFTTLTNLSVDDLKQIFLSTNPENHKDTLKGALYYQNISNATQAQKEFTIKAELALSDIAAMSALNERRLINWGIRLDADKEDEK